MNAFEPLLSRSYLSSAKTLGCKQLFEFFKLITIFHIYFSTPHNWDDVLKGTPRQVCMKIFAHHAEAGDLKSIKSESQKRVKRVFK